MKFNNKEYYSDQICFFNKDSRDFIVDAISQIKQLNQNEKFWYGWNNTSIGNLLLIKNYSKVITLEEKNVIDEILSKIDFTDFNKNLIIKDY